MAVQEIRVPDLEGAENVGVVEIYVSIGDRVELETPLISLESDKAVMDVPSPLAGTIVELKLSEGDTVSTGDLVALSETDADEEKTSATPVSEGSDTTPQKDAEAVGSLPTEGGSGESGSPMEIPVPDLEGSTDVAVVEVYATEGDVVEIESPLISLESDKAVMDVPSPLAGTITSMKVAEGHTVNAGDIIALIQSRAPETPIAKPSAPTQATPPARPPSAPAKEAVAVDSPPINAQPMGSRFHATPSVRGLARELGVDLARVTGTGPKGRITREDVSGLVKSVMSTGAAPTTGGQFALPSIVSADYASFGEVEEVALSRIKKISGPHLHRNWVGVPHVTQFEDADITDLEGFRKSLNEEGSKTGATKISPLIFIIKAVVKTLKEFPDFNSSLNPDGASITRKAYYNIGIAVDTPEGLVVPVIKNAEGKGIRNLAEELGDLSGRAREGKLKSGEMRGASFTISSLGGIGGTYFTPIINAPEVAIIGLSKSRMKPVWNGSEFLPRLILPFSISYDHRVIDGAQGARFAAHLASVIGDIRLALL